MVKLRELKKVKEEMGSRVKDSTFSSLDVVGIKTKKIKSSGKVFMNSLDLAKFDSYHADITKETEIILSGIGRLELNVTKDSKLMIKLLKGIISLKIIVEKGVKLEMLDVSSENNLSKEVLIELEEDSVLHRSEIVMNAVYSVSTVELANRAHHELKSVFYSDSNQMYHINNSIQEEGTSHSTMYIRGFAMNSARVVSEGMIRVGNKSKGCHSAQKIEGILIDEASFISSEPSLQIMTNDVKCSHAASISQISREILFYMNTRGLTEKETISLIIDGVLNDILTHFDTKYSEEILQIIAR